MVRLYHNRDKVFDIKLRFCRFFDTEIKSRRTHYGFWFFPYTVFEKVVEYGF